MPGRGDRGVVTLDRQGTGRQARAVLDCSADRGRRLMRRCSPPSVASIPAIAGSSISSFPSLDGKTVSLHDIDADVILLDFWGSWCAPAGPRSRTSPSCKRRWAQTPASDRNRLRKRSDAPGPPGQCEQGHAGTGNQLSRAAFEQRRILPVAAGASDPVLPDDDLARPRRQAAGREQGATEVTMSRMDRAIKTALKGDGGSGDNQRFAR